MYKPPTSEDVYSYNKGNLFGQFGMDPKGNNESGAWARRNQQLTGAGLTSATSFNLNELEPARQAMLRNLLASMSQGNIQAQTQRNTTAMVNQGQGYGNQVANSAQARGQSAEFADSLRAAFAANAQRSANQYVGSENERFMAGQNQLAQILQQAMQNPFLQEFLAQYGIIENRSNQNKADKAAGSGLGSLGSLAGMLLNAFPTGGGSFSPQTPAARAPGTY